MTEEIQCPEWYRKMSDEQRNRAIVMMWNKSIMHWKFTESEKHLWNWLAQESMKRTEAERMHYETLREIDKDAMEQLLEMEFMS